METVYNIKTIASASLGCKVSAYDAEALIRQFIEDGFSHVQFDEKADVYLINTCSVTNLSDRKSRQLISRAKQLNPDAVIVVSGCYAQVSPDEVKNIPGVNLVIGVAGSTDAVALVKGYKKETGAQAFVTDINERSEYENTAADGLYNRTRAFLKIQDGCDNFCTYCIIPYARGPVRSRNPKDILKEAETLADKGFKEIVLTGIEVASYGRDLHNTGLTDVLKLVHGVEGIERIRFSSAPPGIINTRFLSEIKPLKKICDHFHLSLQSGCDKTLKRMNRPYTAAEYERAVRMIREFYPEAGLTTDIIAGFPGETDEDFEESLQFVSSIDFLKIHAFPYSPRKGTPAASFPGQVDKKTKAERAKRLIEQSHASGSAFKGMLLHKIKPVLFESEAGGFYEGYTTNYIRVRRKSQTDLRNLIIDCEILADES